MNNSTWVQGYAMLDCYGLKIFNVIAPDKFSLMKTLKEHNK